jgi:hypothetical protein
MNNRFGFKDFVQIVLLLGVLILGWMQLIQQDRAFKLQQGIESRLADLDRRLATTQSSGGDELLEKLEGIEQRLASGIVVAQGGAAAPAGRDTSWARPGVPVEWQEPWDFASDPRKEPGFAVGGEFTEIFEGQPAKFTPYLSSDVYGRRVIDRVCDSLGAYDPKTLKFRGVLAEAWQQDPAGMWIRVRLRDGVRFSDGVPLTSEDVRWSYM